VLKNCISLFTRSLLNGAVKNWDDTALNFWMAMDRKGCGKQLLAPEHFKLKPSRFPSVKGHRIGHG
jgi:hypothetical protein